MPCGCTVQWKKTLCSFLEMLKCFQYWYINVENYSPIKWVPTAQSSLECGWRWLIVWGFKHHTSLLPSLKARISRAAGYACVSESLWRACRTWYALKSERSCTHFLNTTLSILNTRKPHFSRIWNIIFLCHVNGYINTPVPHILSWYYTDHKGDCPIYLTLWSY